MHAAPALHAERASSVYILFSSDITTKSEDNFKQKQTRHFLKYRLGSNSSLAIRVNKKVIFCSPVTMIILYYSDCTKNF